jgi:cell division protein FtsI/penicillin-binding protein 2
MKRRFAYLYKKPQKGRFVVIFSFFIIFFILLITRLFFLQIIDYKHYSELAKNNRTVAITLPPQRGLILDRNLRKLVINVPKLSLYAVPRYIEDKDSTAEYIASALDMDKAKILEKISNDKLFVWIARKLPDDVVRQIKSRWPVGIDFLSEDERSYPDNSLAAHILGFVDIDNNGLEGIEKYYDRELKGADGYKVAIVDAKCREVGSIDERFLPPRDGYNVILTIDEVIQHIAEKALTGGVGKYHPKSASVVIMDPSNGEILALCNWPTYNLNNYANSSTETRRNRSITDILEPGSSFKIVTASAALEEEVVGLEDEFYCGNGSYQIADRILHDHTPHGTLKFKNIIEVSSNIGTVKVAQKLGGDKLYKYIKLFGFGRQTGIDLPGEVSGVARGTSKWSKGSIAAVPIGQEIAVTSIQLVAAISCIANDGILMKPRIVKRIIDNNGALIKEFEGEFVRRVMSKETCLKVKKVLSMVVKSGTGQLASVPNYSVAGKTGTGQRLESNGSYSHDKFNSTFIGFAPADNPKLAIAVVFVEPHPYYYGGTVAAPIFSEIASETLRYLGVPPEEGILSTQKKEASPIVAKY